MKTSCGLGQKQFLQTTNGKERCHHIHLWIQTKTVETVASVLKKKRSNGTRFCAFGFFSGKSHVCFLMSPQKKTVWNRPNPFGFHKFLTVFCMVEPPTARLV